MFGQRSVVGGSTPGKRAFPCPEVGHHLVEQIGGGPVEVPVVDGEARRLGTGGHTLDLLDGEQAVVGRAARSHPEA